MSIKNTFLKFLLGHSHSIINDVSHLSHCVTGSVTITVSGDPRQVSLPAASMVIGCAVRVVAALLVLGQGLWAETLLDLSHDLASDSRKWITHEPFVKTEIFKGYTQKGYW